MIAEERMGENETEKLDKCQTGFSVRSEGVFVRRTSGSPVVLGMTSRRKVNEKKKRKAGRSRDVTELDNDDDDDDDIDRDVRWWSSCRWDEKREEKEKRKWSEGPHHPPLIFTHANTKTTPFKTTSSRKSSARP
uniref:Uncharacterized protein n=1 Tax=Vespula pensylvanica TaxID=30213 RepID=A0A834UFH6_VESPE|nr:hypothetical protein H0235_003631 [Vespula pensylvanica]